MNRAIFKITGTGPLLFSQAVFEDKRDDETHEQKEERLWKQKAIIDADGHLALKSAAFQESLVFAGKWLGMKLDGKKTYTARFVSGVTSDVEYFPLSNGTHRLTIDDVERYPLYVPSDGKKKGKNRVWRIFPRLKPGWWLEGSLIVIDEAITPKVFSKHLHTCGLYDGMGGMRVGNGGPNGRFVVDSVEFEPFDF